MNKSKFNVTNPKMLLKQRKIEINWSDIILMQLEVSLASNS